MLLAILDSLAESKDLYARLMPRDLDWLQREHGHTCGMPALDDGLRPICSFIADNPRRYVKLVKRVKIALLPLILLEQCWVMTGPNALCSFLIHTISPAFRINLLSLQLKMIARSICVGVRSGRRPLPR